jgi:Enoyl-CoA hydratase/carnithine racemase
MSNTEELANGELLVEVRNHVAHLTLNRPAQLNALSFGMISAMAKLFTRWATDGNIRAVVVRGAGEKAFCAGGDIRALRDSALSGSTLHHDFFIAEYALDYQLHRFVKPCISLLDGIVMGGGMMQQSQLFPLLRREVQHLLNGYLQSPTILHDIDRYIVPPLFGKRAGVLGALALAERARG